MASYGDDDIRNRPFLFDQHTDAAASGVLSIAITGLAERRLFRARVARRFLYFAVILN
jgi:hypothetical protein